MAREVYFVSPLSDLSLDAINRLITELNAALARIADNEARLEGLNGVPKMSADIDMQGHRLRNLGPALLDSDAVRLDQLPSVTTVESGDESVLLDAQAAPPEVEDAGAIGAFNGRAAREQHTHSGVNLSDDQTIAGRKRFTGDQIAFLNAALAAQRTHVADPSGGGTQDAEARTAINAILVTLETFGFHATS